MEEEAEDSRTRTMIVGKRQVPRKLWRVLHFMLVVQNKPAITKNSIVCDQSHQEGF